MVLQLGLSLDIGELEHCLAFESMAIGLVALVVDTSEHLAADTSEDLAAGTLVDLMVTHTQLVAAGTSVVMEGQRKGIVAALEAAG